MVRESLFLFAGRAGAGGPRRIVLPPRCSWGMVKGVALGFLGATCGLYAILADIRNCRGVTPTRRLK